MNILLEAYLERNFGDDLFVTLLTMHYKEHTFFLIDNQARGLTVTDCEGVDIQSISEESAHQRIADFDAYVLVGGDFYSPYSEYGGRMYRAEKVKENGGSVIILGASLYSDYPQERLEIVHGFFEVADLITFRDSTSYNQCRKLMPNARAFLSSDMIFTMEPVGGKTDHENHACKNLGISVRKKMDASKEEYEIYCETIADVVQAHLSKKDENTVSLLALSTSDFDDRDAADKVKGLLPRNMVSRVKVLDYSRDVFQYIEQVNTCDAIVSTRFHSLCLAIILRKPFFPINYEAKCKNLLDDLGYTGEVAIYGEKYPAEKVLTSITTNHVDPDFYQKYVARANSFFALSDILLGHENDGRNTDDIQKIWSDTNAVLFQMIKEKKKNKQELLNSKSQLEDMHCISEENRMRAEQWESKCHEAESMIQEDSESINRLSEQVREQAEQLCMTKRNLQEKAQQAEDISKQLQEQIEQFSEYKEQLQEQQKATQHINTEIMREKDQKLLTSENRIISAERETNEIKATLEAIRAQLFTIQTVLSQANAEAESLEYWMRIAGRSEPMRIAHFLVQLKHALFGTREERKECWRWLRGDRSFLPKYSYIRQGAVRASQLHEKVNNAIFAVDTMANVSVSNVRTDEGKEALATPLVDGMRELAKMFDEYNGKTVIVLPELVDWNIPLFQRPQQLAMSFAELGILFVYFTPNGNDNVHSAKKLMDNCILLPAEWFDQAITMLVQRNFQVILDIWSTDNHHFMPWIDHYCNMGCRILYEYIDEISDDITGKVPHGTFVRHQALLEDEKVSVVATADKLYNEVISVRGCEVNCLNSGNGVDLKHFRVKTDKSLIPASVRSIIRSNKPIIGYFGAIANWFDFELVAYAAKQRKNYEFMMIGPHYGEHDLSCLEEIKGIPNLHFVGTIDYKILPHVANSFAVATIPFKLNEITESTSPIKLFEYMAMGKPIVTTAMRECFKYPVVRIAKDKEDYVVALDEAVSKIGNPEFQRNIAEMAERNSWQKKAQEICELLNITE